MQAQSTPTDDIPQLAHGWTPELKTRFLDHLSHKGNVRAACKRVGLSREAAYRLRRRDPLFARGWAAALLKARDVAEEELGDRAIEGIEEPIYYRGELIGTRRRFDSRLLLAHLARLDKLVDEEKAGADAGRFDELLAVIAGEPLPADLETDEDVLPLDRQTAARQTANGAEAEVRYLDEHGDDADGDGPAPDPAPLAVRCLTARHRGRAEGVALWDAWFAGACGRVDRLCGKPGAPPAPGLPGNPSAPPPAPASPGEQFEGRAVFSPRTLSDVSSSSLARALAGPAKGFEMTPRSPITAPR